MLASSAPIRVVIAGTGTGIGKTHVACALIRNIAARGLTVVGLKPIETGLDDGALTDQSRLSAAARFHVKQPGGVSVPEGEPFHVKPSAYWFGPGISPHIAAREAGMRIDVGEVRAWVLDAEKRRGARFAVIEAAGGLFSPVSTGATNLDLALALEPTFVVLVAPDRLGVLHDVTATTNGFANAVGRPVDAVVLSEPNSPDRSTGRNAAEIESLGIARVCAVFSRDLDDSPTAQRQAGQLFDWIDRAVTLRGGRR